MVRIIAQNCAPNCARRTCMTIAWSLYSVLKTGYGLANQIVSASRWRTFKWWSSASCAVSTLRTSKKASATLLNIVLYSESGFLRRKRDGQYTHASAGSAAHSPSHVAASCPRTSMLYSPICRKLSTRFIPVRIEPLPPTPSSITSPSAAELASARASVPGTSRSPPGRVACTGGRYTRKAEPNSPLSRARSRLSTANAASDSCSCCRRAAAAGVAGVDACGVGIVAPAGSAGAGADTGSTSAAALRACCGSWISVGGRSRTVTGGGSGLSSSSASSPHTPPHTRPLRQKPE